jgi:hypothetical protein
MKRNDKEFLELMYQFEKDVRTWPVYTTKDFRRCKSEYAFYENGNINDLFHAYMAGYQHAKCLAKCDSLNLNEA